MYGHAQLFRLGSMDLNSGAHAYSASTLLLSYLPSSYLFIFEVEAQVDQGVLEVIM